jgi:hypothetical protein
VTGSQEEGQLVQNWGALVVHGGTADKEGASTVVHKLWLGRAARPSSRAARGVRGGA